MQQNIFAKLLSRIPLLFAGLFLLSACDSHMGHAALAKSVANTANDAITKKKAKRSYKYTVRGVTYHVLESAEGFQEIGSASWYGPGFHGRKTANGEIFDMYAMTAAHKTLPLGSKVRVTNLSNGKQLDVRINDRGPFLKGRIIDLSKKAAQKLDIIKHGHAKVHVKALP